MKDKLRDRVAGVLSLGNSAKTLIEYALAGEKALRLLPELLAILDTEGDGGAVDAVSRKSALVAITHVEQYNGPGRANQARAMLESATHPARVVSDEDVEGAWMVLTGRAGSIAHEKDHECMMDIERKAVRAALEHFAAIAQEKQS